MAGSHCLAHTGTREGGEETRKHPREGRIMNTPQHKEDNIAVSAEGGGRINSEYKLVVEVKEEGRNTVTK